MTKFPNPVLFCLCLFLPVFFSAGCGNSGYRDGTYTGKSGPDDNGAFGEVTLTVREGKITDCSFVTRQKDGTVKDENYGKINGEISNQSYYDKAQLAVRAMEKYARDLSRTGNLEDLEAVSGATIAYNQFREAVEDALETAGKR
ncbi:MAG: FMN-binding protein [Treponema sp.]|jgi:major membrane immunogen (membrane-anchored lipoprotein)|nr:FMN-binding protein [Treponema sp.]